MTINCWWCSGSGEMRTGSKDPDHRVKCAHCDGTGNSVNPLDEPDIDTHGKRIGFGKHRGELWTRLPISYLRWMCNQGTQSADHAAAELMRRGVPLQVSVVEISGHAIDSASLRLWSKYKGDRLNCNEGLHAWLLRFAERALNNTGPDSDGRIHFEGVRLVFETGQIWPILKTVMRSKNNSKPSRNVRQSDTD